MVNSNLSITRRCNDILLEHITQSECNNLNNAQYTRRETLKINPVPSDIADDVLAYQENRMTCKLVTT